MSAPYMQSIFSSLQSNPDQAATLMQGAFAGNPQLQQQVRFYIFVHFSFPCQKELKSDFILQIDN